MPTRLPRVVLDTNILVRGLLNRRSNSGRILTACEVRRMVPLLSRELLSEYRFVLNHPSLREKYPRLDPAKVKTAIERLTYLGHLVRRVEARFEFPRDPKDEKLITLAISGQATHLVTTDHDLLELPHGTGNASRRFRQRIRNVEVLTPESFVAHLGPQLGIQRD